MSDTQSLQICITPFTGSEADYAHWTVVRNAIAPEYARTVDEVKQWDKNRDPKCKEERWLAEYEGQVVARCNFSQNAWEYHPRKFFVEVTVIPEMQGKGVGGRLYDHVMKALEPHDPLSVRCVMRKDWDSSVCFAKRRGFVEIFRSWESRLNVESFDFAPFAHRYTEPEKHGIAIKTAKQLRAEWPDLMERWYEMDKEATMDVPSVEPITFPAFEQWVKWLEGNPKIVWDSIFLAVDEARHEVAGVSSLWKRETDTDLDTGFTGVRPSYRRRGIAFALKLRAIEYARSVNSPTIRTDNASINRPMLSINEVLGFEKQPAWVEMIKTLRQE